MTVPRRLIQPGLTLQLLCVFLLLSWTAAPAQEKRPPRIDAPADEPYVHEPSGAVFPAKIEQTARIDLVRYDDEGHNISAGYEQSQPKFRITVYVYPTLGQALEEHFERINAEIEQVHKGVKLVEKRPWRLKQGGVEHTGRRSKFTIAGFGDSGAQVISEAYLLQIGQWFVKYRISYPASSAPSAAKVIAAVHDGVQVPKQ